MSNTGSKNDTGGHATDRVVVLLAALLTKDHPNVLDKVRVLAPLGLTTAEMAAACGTGANVIRARLADLKKSKSKGSKE